MVNKRLLKETKIKRYYLPLNIIQTLLNAVFIILNAYFLALIINSVFIIKNFNAIKFYSLLFILNALLKSFSNFIFDHLIMKFSEHIKNNLKNSLFKLIKEANPFKVKEQDKGGLINLLTDGCDTLTPYYAQYIPQFFSTIIIPLSILIFVATMDLLSAGIMLLTYPVIPLFMILIGHKTKEKNDLQWKKLTILSSHFLDMLQGLRTLKIFGRSKLQEKKIFTVSENYRKSTMRVLKVAFLSALVLETTATISTAVVAVNLGLRLVYSRIDFLTAFFILVITPEFYAPLRQLGVKFHASLNAEVAVDKITEVETNLHNDVLKQSTLSQEEEIEKIVVSNLNFAHQNHETLNHINLEINKSQKIALIGESGSGKSTLINILMGFLKPPDHTVFINGKDINTLDKESFIKKLSIVPQEVHLFNMSIEDNILMGKSMSKKDFLNICRMTKIDQFVEKFKDKYKTMIGEGEEIEISGGEKQRIAMARVLVKNTDVVIFDEPTSALDPETELYLTDVINHHLREKLVIIVAHRLNTIKSCDTILVLNKGAIIESGNHKELISHKSNYYQMYKAIEVEK